jgi:Glyoxalase-like domain
MAGMHHSRLAGFIIDCRTEDLDGAAQFWSRALGLPMLGADGELYVRLDGAGRDLTIEVQQVDHDSRVHLDLETDDVDAEASRLEQLGARRVVRKPRWWVMEAPSGQRFCVVLARRALRGLPGVTAWP